MEVGGSTSMRAACLHAIALRAPAAYMAVHAHKCTTVLGNAGPLHLRLLHGAHVAVGSCTQSLRTVVVAILFN